MRRRKKSTRNTEGLPEFSTKLDETIDKWSPDIANVAGVSKNFARNVMRIIFAADAIADIKSIAEDMTQIKECEDCKATHIGFPDELTCIRCGGKLVASGAYKYGEVDVRVLPAGQGGDSGDAPSQGEGSGKD